MSMLKKGPELKPPDVKVPDFFLDIYYDLRERHLLPLVGILLVAIVALPIILSSSSGSDSTEPTSEGAIASTGAAVPSSKLVVAKATPGLREYRRRLAGRSPTNPFKQQYAAPEGEGSEASSSSTGENATLSEESSPAAEPTSEPASTETANTTGPSQGSGEPSDGQHLQYYSFAIDVRIVPVSSEASVSKVEPSIRRNQPELTMLPSRKEPALTFMSVSKDEKRALMLVSDKVSGLFGDAICLVGSEHCQLLALEQGVPETVVYGPQERTFRIELLKLHLLATNELHKAPLGGSKQKGSGAKESGPQPAGRAQPR
jgi:hypothetical protein